MEALDHPAPHALPYAFLPFDHSWVAASMTNWFISKVFSWVLSVILATSQTWAETYYTLRHSWEMTHTIMQTDKSQDQQSASWKPRVRQWYSFSPKVSRLKSQEQLIFQFKWEGGRKTNVPAQISQAERVLPYLCMGGSAFFYSDLQLIGWRGWSALLGPLILPEKPRILFDQMSGYTMAQSSWHWKLTIITLWLKL